eukprot:gene8195-1463_t
MDDKLKELRELVFMHERGALTDDEFASFKKQLAEGGPKPGSGAGHAPEPSPDRLPPRPAASFPVTAAAPVASHGGPGKTSLGLLLTPAMQPPDCLRLVLRVAGGKLSYKPMHDKATLHEHAKKLLFHQKDQVLHLVPVCGPDCKDKSSILQHLIHGRGIVYPASGGPSSPSGHTQDFLSLNVRPFAPADCPSLCMDFGSAWNLQSKASQPSSASTAFFSVDPAGPLPLYLPVLLTARLVVLVLPQCRSLAQVIDAVSWLKAAADPVTPAVSATSPSACPFASLALILIKDTHDQTLPTTAGIKDYLMYDEPDTSPEAGERNAIRNALRAFSGLSVHQIPGMSEGIPPLCTTLQIVLVLMLYSECQSPCVRADRMVTASLVISAFSLVPWQLQVDGYVTMTRQSLKTGIGLAEAESTSKVALHSSKEEFKNWLSQAVDPPWYSTQAMHDKGRQLWPQLLSNWKSRRQCSLPVAAVSWLTQHLEQRCYHALSPCPDCKADCLHAQFSHEDLQALLPRTEQMAYSQLVSVKMSLTPALKASLNAALTSAQAY